MKCIKFFQKKCWLALIAGLIFFSIMSCNSGSSSPEEMQTDSTSPEPYEDSSTIPLSNAKDSVKASEAQKDSIVFKNDSTIHLPPIPLPKDIHTGSEKPALLPQGKIAKGNAMVYCPPKMIDGLPSIVNATITKEELSGALKEFGKKIGQENPELTQREINSNIKNETIDLYERMAVSLEFDPDVFKISPKEASLTKSFGDKDKLEWEWEITPIHTTEKSFVRFIFYYADADGNNLVEIFDKRISVNVKVDKRQYLDKWQDFLLGDPKNTTTAILIPLATFLGGFFTGKKNKKAA